MRLLFLVAVVGLIAASAQAHTIAVRTGGGSTGLCFGGLLGTDWESLLADEDDVDGEESIENDCGVAITSLDLQLSHNGDTLSHPPEIPLIAGDSVFDTFQIFSTENGDVLRFFSSTGNSFSSSCFEGPCPPDGTHSPFFIFSVVPHGDDPYGFFRVLNFNQPPDAVVPEPATLLLLGAGLSGMALKRRRRS